MLFETNKRRFDINLVGELFTCVNVLLRKYPSGEMSSQESLRWESVQSRKCPYTHYSSFFIYDLEHPSFQSQQHKHQNNV